MPTPPRPDAIVFDLDGTLVDTVDDRIEAWADAFAERSIEFTRGQLEPMIGMDGRRLAREVARAAARSLTDAEVEELDRRSGELFDGRNRDPRPLPGARELLGRLDAEGITWAIATSSRPEQVARSVAALRVGREPRIVDGSRVEHAKPAPDLLLLAARELGTRPERTWYVGDSTWDMQASAAAGMPGIGVTAGAAVDAEALRLAGAHDVVGTLDELELGR
jgi:HAD superfamily hydrolase (TIGR01509 family)